MSQRLVTAVLAQEQNQDLPLKIVVLVAALVKCVSNKGFLRSSAPVHHAKDKAKSSLILAKAVLGKAVLIKHKI